MNYEGAALLIGLLDSIDVFFVVFVRVMGFFLILPVMSGQNMPMMSRIALALGVAFFCFMSGMIALPDYNFTIFGFGFLLLSEFLVGMIISFVIMMLFSLFHFVGQMVDHQMGFAMVSVLDPLGQQQAPVTGNLYFLIVSVFFVQTGALHHVIRILFESFGVIDIGSAFLLGNANIIAYVIEIIIVYFIFGVRFALPVVGTLIIVDIVLGILVKAVPQMNVFVVGMPLKVLVGLFVVFVTLPSFAPIFGLVMNDVIGYILNILRGMMPS
ncbi:MAG: flagellar biosynthetic protein FliR [Defluviitaleaceae bacterium]|nr:flagellar biosynthetic protein FliR [Defluviitaleaceae bacterium]